MRKSAVRSLAFVLLAGYCFATSAATFSVGRRQMFDSQPVKPDLIVDASNWSRTNSLSEGTNAVEVVAAMMTDWLENLYLFQLPVHLKEFPANRVLSFSELDSFLTERKLATEDYTLFRNYFSTIDDEINPKPIIKHREGIYVPSRTPPRSPPEPEVQIRNFSLNIRLRDHRKLPRILSESGDDMGRYEPPSDVVEEMHKFPVYFRNPSVSEEARQLKKVATDPVNVDPTQLLPSASDYGLRAGWSYAGGGMKVKQESPLKILDYEPNIWGTINNRVSDLVHFPTAATEGREIRGPIFQNELPVPAPVLAAIRHVYAELFASLEQTKPGATEAVRSFSLVASIDSQIGDERSRFARADDLYEILFLKTNLEQHQIHISTFLLRAIFFKIMQTQPPPFAQRAQPRPGKGTFGGGEVLDKLDFFANRASVRVPEHPKWTTEVYARYVQALQFPLAHEMAHVYGANGDIPASCRTADAAAVQHLRKTYEKPTLGAFDSLLVQAVSNGAVREWALAPNDVGELKDRYDKLQELLRSK